MGSTVDPLRHSGEHARGLPARLKAKAEAGRAPGVSKADAGRRLCAFSVVSLHPLELAAQLAESTLIHTLRTTDPNAGYNKLKGKLTWDRGTCARIFAKKKGRPPPRK